jgi:hypothetical protein
VLVGKGPSDTRRINFHCSEIATFVYRPLYFHSDSNFTKAEQEAFEQDVEDKEQFRVEVANRFAALEDLDIGGN